MIVEKYQLWSRKYWFQVIAAYSKCVLSKSLNVLLCIKCLPWQSNPLHMWCSLHAVYHVGITIPILWGSLGLEILIIYPKSHRCKHCSNNSNWGRPDSKVCPLEYCSTLKHQVSFYFIKGTSPLPTESNEIMYMAMYYKM